MSKKVGLVILAAGQGSRLKLNYPKPIVPLLGLTLIDYSLDALDAFTQKNSLDAFYGVVVGHKRELVMDHLKKNYNDTSKLNFAIQEEQNGTAHALKCYFDQITAAKESDYTVIMCADTPLIRAEHLNKMFEVLQGEDLDGVVASFEANDPTGYGRIVRHTKGLQIVEHKDASDEQRSIKEVNSGLYIIKTQYILDNLFSIDSNNKSNEYYLTDLFKEGSAVAPVQFDNEDDFLGINTVEQLYQAKDILNEQLRKFHHQTNQVFFLDKNVHIDATVKIGKNTVIHPNVYIYGKTVIGDNCEIEPGSIIKDSIIENEVVVKGYSYFEEASVGNKAVIGPYARLRPKAEIGEESKIGNFVEIKKAKLDKGVKVSHLSYVGDAEIGENTNIGCGFITCNYDGAKKHLTKIGRDSFIGSDTQMIAPVEIGDESYVGSGSTINQDVPSGAFAIARTRQVTKEGMARKFIKKK